MRSLGVLPLSFTYAPVKRFVRRLKARAPERYDVLEFLPGE